MQSGLTFAILTAMGGLLAGVIGAIAVLEARPDNRAATASTTSSATRRSARIDTEIQFEEDNDVRRPQTRRVYRNVFAQQLAHVLADPAADSGELIDAVDRSLLDGFDGEVYDALLCALDHPDPRVVAATLLVLLDEPDAVIPFSLAAAKLEHADWRVRQLALAIAATIPATRAVDVVLSVRREANDEGAYAFALEQLLDHQRLNDHEEAAITRELDAMHDVDPHEWFDRMWDLVILDRW